jgi:hypothetical protein
MNNENLSKYDQPSAEQSDRKKPAATQPLLFALTLIGGMFIGTNLGDKKSFAGQVRNGTQSK